MICPVCGEYVYECPDEDCFNNCSKCGTLCCWKIDIVCTLNGRCSKCPDNEKYLKKFWGKYYEPHLYNFPKKDGG